MSTTMFRNDCWSEEQHRELIEYTSENLWRFVQQNSILQSKEKSFLDITGLSRKNFEKLCDIHFLLSKEVSEFIYVTAPAILNRLSKNSIKETHMLRGRIKGKVLWSKTVTYRYSFGGDPSLFVCQQRASLFDLPENRVFLYTLKKIFQISKTLFELDSLDEVIIEDQKANAKWSNVVQKIAVQSNKYLRNPFLREISDIHDLSGRMIQETERARGASYTQLAITASLLYKAKNHPVDFLYDKLSKQMLQPLNRDVLYEIAVLFQIIEHANLNGWKEKKINLIGGGSKVLSRLKKGDITMNIYFQSLPTPFVKNSKYKDVMNQYQIEVGYRRPDIILEWINEDGISRYCIVEVKRSRNREYLIDGLYKLLGYIKDFEEVFAHTPNSKGILVGWKTETSDAVLEEKEFYFTGWNKLNSHLDIIEKNLIEQIIKTRIK